MESASEEPSKLARVAAGAGPVLAHAAELDPPAHTSAQFHRDWNDKERDQYRLLPATGFPVFEELETGLGLYFVPLLILRKWPPLLRLDLRDSWRDCP
jgi:hypothetical protein